MYTVVKSLYYLGLGEVLALVFKVAHHKLFVRFGYSLSHCGTQTFQTVFRRRHGYFGRYAVVISICLHFKQVYVAFNGAVLVKGNDYGAYGRTELRLKLLKALVEVAVFFFHTGDNEHCRLAVLYRLSVSLYGADLNAVLCGKRYYNAFCGADSFVKSCSKIKLTGSIENIYFNVFPLAVSKRSTE